jgi:hypothetical protein
MAFESILLFSLAVLIIAVGLLVYYFKKRIAEVEQKTSKSLEIVHDLYMQQVKMKSDFNAIIQSLQEEDEPVPDNNIQFTFLNHELANMHNGGSYEEAEEVFDQSGTFGANQSGTFGALMEPLDIKTVNVDMTLPDEDLIEITNDDESLDEPEEDDEPEQPELLEEDHVVVEKIGSEESQPQTVSKEDLKKMTPSTLKSLIISKGVSAEAVHKLKKNELIDVLLKL